MSYFTEGQIVRAYEGLDDKTKIVTLTTALEIKNIHPEKDKKVCIAMAMGYNLSISGSGFYEKILPR